MASITLANKEIIPCIDLMGQLFPVDLSAVKKMLTGVQMQGKVTLTKTVAANETLSVDVTITP